MAGYGYTKNKKIEENTRNYGEKRKKSEFDRRGNSRDRKAVPHYKCCQK